MKSQNVDALHQAKKNKSDEFYTSLYDIDCEMKYYENEFKNKTIYCCCDDPEESMFTKHFVDGFKRYELSKLICTSYNPNGTAFKLEYTLDENNNIKLIKTPLEGNGDFRSEECTKILEESDIVVTNPPFSLFREFIAWLEDHHKKYNVLGHINAISYKEIFKLIFEKKIWLGKSIHSGDREFRVPDSYGLNAAGCRIDSFGTKWIRVSGVRWFTNMDYKDRHEPIPLCKKYSSEEYPKYDNYDAINVNITVNIPCDYDGIMGVPITYFDKHCPDQFDIIALGNLNGFTPTKKYNNPVSHIDNKVLKNEMINSVLTLKGKDSKGHYYTADNIDYTVYAPYARILIRKNKEFKDEFAW